MKNLLDLAGELKIELAEAADGVRSKVHGHFIPHVGPFRMMVHGLRRKRHNSHVTKGVGEIATSECADAASRISDSGLSVWCAP